MSVRVAVLLVLVLFVLHQDFWWWTDARPVVFGILPIGLFYHVAYTLVTALVLWALVRFRFPADDAGPEGPAYVREK